MPSLSLAHGISPHLLPADDIADLPALLRVLGYGPDEFVSVCHKVGKGGRFNTEVVPSSGAAAAVSALPDGADIWYGVNPVRGPARRRAGRGKAEDVTRLTALVADLDVEPKKCPSIEVAEKIITAISDALGCHPVAVVNSGHGLHPYWLVSDQTVVDTGQAKGLLERFGEIVKHIAAQHDCKVDAVFDLPRVLRVPGTLNHKDAANPAPVTTRRDTGTPMSVATLTRALDGNRRESKQTPQTIRNQGGETFTRKALVARVAKASEGERNRTLFGAAKDAAAQGILDDKLIADLADAALAVGLDSTEIHDTINSGRRKAETSKAPTVKLWRATDLHAAAAPNWLARGRLPRGAISLLVGDEGIGKSLLWVWVAAAVTTGKPLPEFGIPARQPADVIVAVTEDDWSSTVRPRLELAGADLSRVRVICEEADGSGSPEFPRHLPLIAAADPAPALVVVDAWLDTVPAGLSVKDPQQARQALHPWKELATVTGAAVLLLTHTNRVVSASARDKYGATGELRKKARMTLFAQADEDGLLVVGPEKSNTAKALPASQFSIDAVQVFAPTEDSDGTVPVLTFVGESDRTARELVADAANADVPAARVDDFTEIDNWLTEFLTSGPVKASEIFSSADAAGYSKDQAKRAKKRLGIVADRPANPGPWFWSIQQTQEGQDAQSREQSAPLHSVLPVLSVLPVRSDGVRAERTEQGAQSASDGVEPCSLVAPSVPAGLQIASQQPTTAIEKAN